MQLDRGLTIKRTDDSGAHPALRLIARIDDVVHVIIAVVLLGLAFAVLGHAVWDVFANDQPFALRVTQTVNDVLFVIIIMEILRTVTDHVVTGTFPLMPFVAIGIISAVRHILTVGSTLTMNKVLDHGSFDRLLIELGVNALVALSLVVALVLLRRSTRPAPDPAG